jgi:hypothetical protein
LKVLFAVLADYSNVTQEGKINILGIFDIIHAPQFPAVHPEMQLVLRLEADVSERNQQKDVEVRLIDDRGEKILTLHGRIAVRDTKADALLFYTQVLVLQSIVFSRPGDYQFDIYIDGNKRHSTPLKVVLVQ